MEKKKTIKAWAVVNERGVIKDTAFDGWNFHYGVFRTKSAALSEYPWSCKVIPCTITYSLPKVKKLRK